jgi:hypothetical protein
MGEHGEGDVPVPGAVLADLLVVQAGLALGLVEAVLHGPPRARDRHQLSEGGRAGRPAPVERQLKGALLVLLQGPADQQVMPR